MVPELLSQIPADQDLASVTADGAYDTRKCHDAIAERGAHALIPRRKNARPWKTVTAGSIARNEALRTSKYLGRAPCDDGVDDSQRESMRLDGVGEQDIPQPLPHDELLQLLSAAAQAWVAAAPANDWDGCQPAEVGKLELVRA